MCAGPAPSLHASNVIGLCKGQESLPQSIWHSHRVQIICIFKKAVGSTACCVGTTTTHSGVGAPDARLLEQACSALPSQSANVAACLRMELNCLACQNATQASYPRMTVLVLVSLSACRCSSLATMIIRGSSAASDVSDFALPFRTCVEPRLSCPL